jgi:hypothetical protein
LIVQVKDIQFEIADILMIIGQGKKDVLDQF